MTRWGIRYGGRLPVLVLVAAGSVASTAPAAFAHGDHGAELAAHSEPAGPYTVTVWVEEQADETVTANVIIDGRGIETPPGLWLETNEGRVALGEPITVQANTWIFEFRSTGESSLVVSWATARGNGEMAVLLEGLPAPWWFRPILVVVTVPGLWFANWLWKRRRRAFGLAPLSV